MVTTRIRLHWCWQARALRWTCVLGVLALGGCALPRRDAPLTIFGAVLQLTMTLKNVVVAWGSQLEISAFLKDDGDPKRGANVLKRAREGAAAAGLALGERAEDRVERRDHRQSDAESHEPERRREIAVLDRLVSDKP